MMLVGWISSFAEMVHGERFVVAQGEEEEVGRGGKEGGVGDGAAVVLHLQQGVVFVGDGGVVDVDEAVGAAGEETVGQARVELQRRHVIVVAFDVALQRAGGGAQVPGTVNESLASGWGFAQGTVV